MTEADDFIRSRGRRPRVERKEPEEAPKPPLVSQGPRSRGYPCPQVSVDDLIRAAAGRSFSAGGWVRIA
jgi:hypothetical protein